MSQATLARETEPASARSPHSLIANAREGADARFIVERALAARLLVVVARDAQRGDAIRKLVKFFNPEIETRILPAWDCLPYDRVSPSTEVMATRLATLLALTNPTEAPARVVIVTANAFAQRLPPPEAIIDAHLVLRAGRKVDREALTRFLERNGYRRTGTVIERGEYAVRGGLIDIFPTGAKSPVRLDFFGSTLEGLRAFDPTSQRSGDRRKGVVLRPVSEVMFDERAVERFRQNYLKAFGAVTGDPLFESITNARAFPGMEHWLPLFHDELADIFDYLDRDPEIVLDHLAKEALQARAALVGEHYEARCEPEFKTASFGGSRYRALEPAALYLDEQEINHLLAAHPRHSLSIFTTPPTVPGGVDRIEDLRAVAGRDFAPERQNREINLFDAIAAHIAELRRQNKSPILACSSRGAADRLAQVLGDHGVDPPNRIDCFADHRAGSLGLAVLPIDRSIDAPGLCILGEQDLLGERLSRAATKRRRRSDKFIAEVGALAEGDLVVHNEHGIGRFDGLVTLEIGGAPHDCLQLAYAGGDKLFLPVENIDIITRYGQSASDHPLDKLGGVGWQNRKARIKERIREIAQELIDVAAARQLRTGEAFGLHEGIYDDFAARFPYEETEDQLKAIEAVLGDLSSGRPMDRLVCGDVGFGKTEVAIRAAFVAAMSGKQVAILAPTTLLARQHFHVFQTRFSGMPIRVGHISRFVSAKDANAVKKALGDGQLDIVIGTHALLAKGVSFKNLGLVIIDEEQHFGVAHKERLKQMRAEVHVLTMTATPIPRTLHMALGGMKDLSIIATPPVDRLAVRSFVMPADPVVLREALLREHHRGGQSYYVCPRVSDQPKLKEELERIVPELKIAVANGQIPVKELEETMAAFYDRKVDLLLATNIIESGLDIPTANTLIVHRADMFGLSQLYQLRGRVGRSKLRGYAYFTVPADKTLQASAERRLSVIQSLEGLGAGFQLASHDLDIRGAGNLLGDEQSGQIKEVGFELYNQMLDEAVQALRASDELEARIDWTPQITVDASALMPESYIADIDLRLSLYRRLASLESDGEIDSFAAELIDRFGPIPPETEHLLQIIAIKQLCKRAHVHKLDIGPKGVVLSFFDDKFPKPEKLIRHIGASRGAMRVRPDHKLVLLRETKSPDERLKVARKLVDELAGLAA